MATKPKPKSSEPDMVPLKGGLTLHETSIWLCLELDKKGWELKRQGPKLMLTPARKEPDVLTDSDRELIGKWKPELLQIADYLTMEVTVG